MNIHERITILNRTRDELVDLHRDQYLPCPGPAHCPIARVLADLEMVIAEITIEASQAPDGVSMAGGEATYPGMTVEDVATAVLTAQAGIGQ